MIQGVIFFGIPHPLLLLPRFLILSILNDKIESAILGKINSYGIIRETMLKKLPSKTDLQRVAIISSLGLMLPSSIAVGLFFGYMLDKLLGTHPWMLLIFFLFGVVSGFYNLIKGLNKYKED